MQTCTKCLKEKSFNDFYDRRYKETITKNRICITCCKKTSDFSLNYKKPIDLKGEIYKVSNKGRIKSLDKYIFSSSSKNKKSFRREILLKLKKNTRGQQTVDLTSKTIKKTKLVSRLVATAFIPNPHNLPDVDHILEDKDKTNNTVENLQWITKRDNSKKYFNSINNNKEIGIRIVRNKYQLEFRVNGKYIYAGRFNTQEECIKIREEIYNDNSLISKYNSCKQSFHN
jgi:hypothetical protein